MSHTPGPWSIDLHFHDCYGDTDVCKHAIKSHGFQVATIMNDVPGADANAKLIAAAPDLLAGSIRLLATLDAQLKTPAIEQPDSPMGQLRAAVTKATGAA